MSFGNDAQYTSLYRAVSGAAGSMKKVTPSKSRSPGTSIAQRWGCVQRKPSSESTAQMTTDFGGSACAVEPVPRLGTPLTSEYHDR